MSPSGALTEQAVVRDRVAQQQESATQNTTEATFPGKYERGFVY